MGKNISDLDQYVMAYKLYKLGLTQQQILDELKRQKKFEVRDKRTIASWISQFKNLDEDKQRWGEPFIWRKCDEYGIPDDKVSLQNILFYRAKYIENHKRKPSFREVKWMYWIDSTAEGYWNPSTLVDLAIEYADAELLIDLGRAGEDSYKELDEKFDEQLNLINVNPSRRRAR